MFPSALAEALGLDDERQWVTAQDMAAAAAGVVRPAAEWARWTSTSPPTTS